MRDRIIYIVLRKEYDNIKQIEFVTSDCSKAEKYREKANYYKGNEKISFVITSQTIEE